MCACALTHPDTPRHTHYHHNIYPPLCVFFSHLSFTTHTHPLSPIHNTPRFHPHRAARAGTGVCFTRNPNTGERVLYGEYLINAQGEDVVAGIRYGP